MVVLSIYNPSVSCFGRRVVIQNANNVLQKLLSRIPVGTEYQNFGPEGEPGVQVVLPVTFGSASAIARESLPLSSHFPLQPHLSLIHASFTLGSCHGYPDH